MAHPEQIEFCRSVRVKFPNYFYDKSVLDVGSLDINGNNRYLFKNCSYLGLDLVPGKNIDIDCPVHKFKTLLFENEKFDVIISTETLEHDKYFHKSLKAILNLLRSEGLLIITAATTGRLEHGTINHEPESSPFTNDYYKNVTYPMLYKGLSPEENFINWQCITKHPVGDIYFWGIKK